MLLAAVRPLFRPPATRRRHGKTGQLPPAAGKLAGKLCAGGRNHGRERDPRVPCCRPHPTRDRNTGL